MVTWRVLPCGGGAEVTFGAGDADAWQAFRGEACGVTAPRKLPETSGKGSEASAIDTKWRRRLSLPEAYYAAAIDGILPVDEPMRDLWERLKSSSATFARHFAVYQHFRRLGWMPKPGLNYGAHYVLYRGSAAEFHSEYVVYVQDEGEVSSWNTIQSLTRIAADVKKTVLLCTVSTAAAPACEGGIETDAALTSGTYRFHDVQFTVEAIAIRFWDASIADDPPSYTFQPQPVLPKKSNAAKKKHRAKRPKCQLEGEALTGSANST
ncbi:hypothetical protein PHYPSEUDO_005466 [Phytophthora pseudosyringae]|uniref:tRNA intron endonuclease catalytic domain-containing protein n=1 Tax=Phytophthora pseudosyringae TaxID=221518 RepID=A0A8T1VP38_9STRA|nr:hypothetical protein PHYPSEUDO_005466 [Phytophthora pseudosyringae]